MASKKETLAAMAAMNAAIERLPASAQIVALSWNAVSTGEVQAGCNASIHLFKGIGGKGADGQQKDLFIRPRGDGYDEIYYVDKGVYVFQLKKKPSAADYAGKARPYRRKART